MEQGRGGRTDILSRTHTVWTRYSDGRQVNLRQVMLRNTSLFYTKSYIIYEIFCEQFGSSFVKVHSICFVN